MNVSFKISQSALLKLEESLKKSITKITKEAAVKTYNNIVGGSDFPYWSGSFISSWKISVGSRDSEYNLANIPGVFDIPHQITDVPGSVHFGERIYITNSTPHAYQVEVLGTPLHPHEGWFTAAHAVNQTVLSYKLKF